VAGSVPKVARSHLSNAIVVRVGFHAVQQAQFRRQLAEPPARC